MKTQKELLDEHREQLNERFADKYPNGQFCLQRFERAKYIGMHWCKERPTSHARSLGISVVLHQNDRLVFERFQNNAFGKCTYYDNLDKMLAGARRLGIDYRLINAFVDRYQNKISEGFKV